MIDCAYNLLSTRSAKVEQRKGVPPKKNYPVKATMIITISNATLKRIDFQFLIF